MPITLNGTTGEVFPSWTTATRPASPTAGQTGFNTTTGQMETYDGTSWEIYAATSSQGTSGQYLQSAGAGAAPTWATLSTSGLLIRAPQIKTSGTSYTTPSNCTAIYVEAVGGGGNGGGGGTTNAGAGGGGGAYCAKYFTVTGSTAYTYAIGAGGSGNTTFTVGATTITAGGGSVGGSVPSGASSATANGGAGGSATNGDINVGGGGGGAGFFTLPSGSQIYVNGCGGSSVFGGGGNSTASTGGSAGGNAGKLYGGGASGTQTTTVPSGAQGVIRIWEFT